MVIQSPTDVLFTNSRSVAPPSVMAWFGGLFAKHIDVTGSKEFIHPRPFLGEESGVVDILLRVLQVDFSVGDIVITAKNDALALLSKVLAVLQYRVAKRELIAQSRMLSLAVREICVQ